MGKWASKWLEMRSQIHRFYKIFRGRSPGSHNEGGFNPPLILSPPLAAFAARFKTSAFSAPPPPGNNISGSGPETIADCDLKVGRCRQLIEIMKVCEY